MPADLRSAICEWWLAGSVASLIPVVTDHVEGVRSGDKSGSMRSLDIYKDQDEDDRWLLQCTSLLPS